MLVIPGAGKRTRVLGMAVLAATFIVGGLTGMAMQQARGASQPPAVADDGVLRLPDASGNLRPCPPPRQRFEPLDSIGATAEQQDSIKKITDLWQPRFEAIWRGYDKVQDSLYDDWEVRRDALQDSMQTETRAVLSAEQRSALEALYERRDSTRRAVWEDQQDFERRCRAARRHASSDGNGRGDRSDRDDDSRGGSR